MYFVGLIVQPYFLYIKNKKKRFYFVGGLQNHNLKGINLSFGGGKPLHPPPLMYNSLKNKLRGGILSHPQQ